MTGDEVNEMLDEIAAKLGEHFDAVQLMVTWNEEGITYAAKRGSGNWYARQGLAHEFINADIAVENARQLAEIMPKPEIDDDGEEWKG